VIYLDRITTTPLDERVFRAMEPYLREHWGSPANLGRAGDAPAAALEKARADVSALLGSKSGEIFFTSGGAEASNWAIKGLLRHPRVAGRRVLASPVENLHVRHPLERMRREGFDVSWLSVDPDGRVDPDEVQKMLRREKAALVALVAASGEAGTIEPLADVGRIAREAGAAFFVDATHAAGHVPLDVREMNISLLSLSAHYFYGPKGAGALFRREGIPLLPLVEGGAQEEGLRAGTPNVAGCAGLGEAARLAREEADSRGTHLESLAREIRAALPALDGLSFTGHPTERLPGHVSFCVEGVDGEALLVLLNEEGVTASSGSVCSSEIGKPSHVLQAMGVPPERIKGSLVLASLKSTTREEVREAVRILKRCVERLRA
jgi:cysteine desulfurase